MGEARDQWAALLAHHYAEAARPEDADLAWTGAEDELQEVRQRAVRWLRRAAKLALERYEVDESIVLLERALALTEEEDAAAIWVEVGNANALKYDGEGFLTAMHEALAHSTDPATTAKAYSDLAFQASIRGGMWREHPGRDVVGGWVEQAIALTEEESAERARALIAKASVDPEEGDELARAASGLADRLCDPELRSWAWWARAVAAFESGRFEEALTWAQRRFDLEGTITDPDHIVEMREAAMPPSAALGRLREVRRLALEHEQLTRRLSPHHRIHSAAVLIEAEELAGNWEEIRAREDELLAAVEANRDTPCIRHSRSILLCAAARAYGGDEEGARELEAASNEHHMRGHVYALEAVQIRLALARNDLGQLSEVIALEGMHRYVFSLHDTAARLDAMAALGDRERAETKASSFLQAGTYLEPFALRTLGIVREDDALIGQAQERFKALGLEWHAAQTESLRG